MAKRIYRERRVVRSPFVVADHLLESAAVKLEDEQVYDPASTAKQLSKLTPGEDFSCSLRIETMSDFKLPEMDSLKLAVWTYSSSGTARQNKLHSTYKLSEVSDRKILNIHIPGQEFLGQEFGLRIAVLKPAIDSRPPLIIGDKVFNFRIDHPELFPTRYESFSRSGYPSGAIWRLNIEADDPEENLIRINDGRPNIELILNNDIDGFVSLTRDAAKRNSETRQAHRVLIKTIATGAFRDLCEWVLSYEKNIDRSELGAELDENSIGYAVLSILKKQLKLDCFEDVVSDWKADEEGRFQTKVQEILKIKNLFR